MLTNLFLSDRKLLNEILRVKLKYMVNVVVVKLLPTLKQLKPKCTGFILSFFFFCIFSSLDC